MNRRFWAGVLFVAAGCKLADSGYPFPADPVPPPADVGGVVVAFDDARPAWEKTPFTGPVSLHRLGRVTPNPWDKIAAETRSVVTALRDKPARVDVSVVSFRLINKEDAVPQKPDPSENVRIGGKSVNDFNNRANAVEYEKLRSATAAGDAKAATTIGTGLVFQNGDPSIGVVAPAEKEDGPGTAFDEHPPGASCRVRAVVRVTDRAGRVKTVDVKAVASGENLSGSKYYGEALDAATKNTIRQYGFQLSKSLAPSES